ncbi:MAG: DJ-1/PfpI family protein [Lentisphaeria bacterium]|nr:DJ-1/PfpI family protein [Lentisphaeria bacterium]
MKKKPTTAVILATGFEEIEAVTIIDVLRRADIPVLTAALSGGRMTRGAHGVNVETDCSLSEIDPRELALLVLPGGMPGSRRLAESQRVIDCLRTVHASGCLVAAMCAAPLALQAAGLLDGKKMTCYPALKDQFPASDYTGEDVVQDGAVITGSGPGTALRFSLRLVEALGLPETAENLRLGMLAL